MIRTRESQEIPIAGSGQFVIAMNIEEIMLLGALLGMVKLGHRQYEQAALKLMDALEEITDDPDFTLTALMEVRPTIKVHEPDTFDVIAEYDETYVFEISV